VQEIFWKIVGRLERAVEWLEATAMGRTVAAVSILVIGALVAWLSAELVYGCLTVAVLVVAFGLIFVLRRENRQ
jgi:hypothetical protein